MLTGAVLAEFALVARLVEITPGPNMAYLAVVAATEGRVKGYAAVAGVALGLLIMGLLAALGLAALIAAYPVLFYALKWSGAAYLFWLAWDGWRTAGEAVDHAAPGSTAAVFFRRGLVNNLLNPKAAVFYITILPGFVDTAATVMVQTVSLSLVYVAIATAIHAGIVTLAGLMRGPLDDQRRNKRVRRVLSVALVGVAIWVIWNN